MPSTEADVGFYDRATGRATIQVQFGAITRRQRKACLAAIDDAGLTVQQFVGFGRSVVNVTGTERQFAAFDHAHFMITGASADTSYAWTQVMLFSRPG
jgi:hypothetical protein